MSEAIFTYGHNMDLPRLKRWLSRYGYDPRGILGAEVALLKGYDLVWNYHSCSGEGGAANIEPSEEGEVWGLLLEVRGELVRAFDHRDNHPTAYTRLSQKIPVRTASGREVPAWVYIARPNYGGRRDVWPTREYKEMLITAAIEHGLPRQYIEKLRNVPEKKKG